jgi:hypothetical protein
VDRARAEAPDLVDQSVARGQVVVRPAGATSRREKRIRKAPPAKRGTNINGAGESEMPPDILHEAVERLIAEGGFELKQRPHIYVIETRHVGPILIFCAQILKLNDIMNMRLTG